LTPTRTDATLLPMKLPLPPIIHLLHEISHATLATQSAQMAGYPYATALPCVVDASHCPVFCVSALAEHTKNLLADARVSLSVVALDSGNVQAAARLTMVGDAEPVAATPELVARYLRYQPDARQYLELDFMFFRLTPKRLRFIAGLGRMGWVEGEEWGNIPVLSPEAEAVLLQEVAPQVPAGIRLLGVDAYGIDYEMAGGRQRQRFPEALAVDDLPEAVARMVPRLG